jgi:hypothetical protein
MVARAYYRLSNKSNILSFLLFREIIIAAAPIINSISQKNNATESPATEKNCSNMFDQE